MVSSEATGFNPNSKQREILGDVASRIVEQTETVDKVRLVGFVEAAKIFLRGVPAVEVDAAVHEACLAVGTEVQLYSPYKYNGDAASPFTPRTVRVLSREGEPVLDPLMEGQYLGNAWQAYNVYPPAADEAEGVH